MLKIDTQELVTLRLRTLIIAVKCMFVYLQLDILTRCTDGCWVNGRTSTASTSTVNVYMISVGLHSNMANDWGIFGTLNYDRHIIYY
jgi:hypothetical protein